MSSIAKVEQHEVTQADPLFLIIQTAARDPDADVDKMERLMAMYERQQGKQAEAEFARAMNHAQQQVTRVQADAVNPQTRSKYATYAALDRALRPIYTENGFSLSFDTGETAPEIVRVLCYVSHEAGFTRTYRVDMPADGKGAKGNDVMTKTHAAGSAMSYGMRYLLKMIFNVAIGEDDDDGNGAAEAELIDARTLADIEALIDEVADTPAKKEATTNWLKSVHKVPNGFVRNIPASKARDIVSALEKKRKQS